MQTERQRDLPATTDGSTKFDYCYSSSKAEVIINKSDTDDARQSLLKL